MKETITEFRRAQYKLPRHRMQNYYKRIVENDTSGCTINYSICMLLESIWAWELEDISEEDSVWFNEMRTFTMLRFPDEYANAMSYIRRIGVG